MKWAFLLIHDGRRDEDGRLLHERTLESAKAALPEPTATIVVDDSEHELGFAGAIALGWQRLRELDVLWRRNNRGEGFDYVFHCEGDFLFNGPVPVARIAGVLERNGYLAQVALKRQPVNAQEITAGGIIEQHPNDYLQVSRGGDTWIEHRRFWTTNPSLYPFGWVHRQWPQEPHSEGLFTHLLLEDPALRFAFWGAKEDAPRVTHIGERRAGHGY